MFNSKFMPEYLLLHRLRDSATPPEYGTRDSACFDLAAAFESNLVIKGFTLYNEETKNTVNAELEYHLLPGERALIPTGWVFGIPRNFSLRVHPRSGLALKNGITLANAEAVIDEDYTQETFIMLLNNSKEVFTVKNGMRLAQGELVEKVKTKFQITDKPITTTSDRLGGLGSTGV